MEIPINREPFEDSPDIPPYRFNGLFHYDLRCCECLAERDHSEEVHLVLTRGWTPEKAQSIIQQYPNVSRFGDGIRFGKPVEVEQ